MDLREETERIILEGYNEANAQAKLCQDIILKAIYKSGMAKNATIKGGVVMRSISGNARRATQDIDIDLIRYSISDESIRASISKLNCIEGMDIRIGGPIIELNHQDYKGKRVTIIITDEHANSLSLKMDIGVHKDLDIEQVFGSKSFIQSVSRSRRNWLDVPAEEALASDLEFFRSLSE